MILPNRQSTTKHLQHGLLGDVVHCYSNTQSQAQRLIICYPLCQAGDNERPSTRGCERRISAVESERVVSSVS
ncbi:hypothetical protein SKAU_G00351750 [Synaphobranchus kaupii]|uniref:Uncharacterized protein n=1 Tax=Synaphobranchus kaupii TaxID=118154 RepID=A0A9Q1EKM2_SYNKA|nr:hypothetical protein SKAU_G00351750 [Synaphobranchus kaupii]